MRIEEFNGENGPTKGKMRNSGIPKYARHGKNQKAIPRNSGIQFKNP